MKYWITYIFFNKYARVTGDETSEVIYMYIYDGVVVDFKHRNIEKMKTVWERFFYTPNTRLHPTYSRCKGIFRLNLLALKFITSECESSALSHRR